MTDPLTPVGTVSQVEHHYHAWCHANANTPIAAATPSCVKAEPLSQQHGTRIDPMDELGADEGAWDGANVTEVEMELEEVATSQPDDDDEDGTEENELVGTLRTLTKQVCELPSSTHCNLAFRPLVASYC